MAPNTIVAPQRRHAIIQATIRCLAREGYARLTMKTLAREAQVSQGILHYYFADKAAILAAAFEAVTEELQQRIASARQQHPPDPSRQLYAVIAACLETAHTCPDIWRVSIQMWGESLHHAPLTEINAALYDKMRHQLSSLLIHGMRQGVFRQVPVEQAAVVLVGLIDGMALQSIFDPQVLPLSTAVTACWETVEHYLRPPTRP